jgi:hypothetical protein
MSKSLKSDAILKTDLEEFLASESDFAFEMSVLSKLREIGFRCKHSGTYQDPVTKKIRQFDIRAEKINENRKLSLAVECKNFRPNFPLLITAIPRTHGEGFHQIIFFRSSHTTDIQTVMSPHSLYIPGEMVGKSTNQVGRAENKSELVSDDGAAFDKINQAVNSAEDLVSASLARNWPEVFRVVVPVLVVPADVLWQIDYDYDGKVVRPVHRVQETTFFIDHAWSTFLGIQGWKFYRMSHLHIVTIGSLKAITEGWTSAEGFFRTCFPVTS